VAKTLQAIDEAHVVIMVLDAHDTVAEQDASVLDWRSSAGGRSSSRSTSGTGLQAEQREQIQRQLALKLDFVPFAPLHFISARHGSGVGELMQSTVRAYRGGDARHADTRADAHTRARADRPPATTGTRPAHQSCVTRTRAAATRRAS